MLMARLSAETKVLLLTESCPAVAITRLNERICSLGVDKFVTLLCLVLDLKSDKVEIVNAGHMAPLWLKTDGSLLEPGYEVSGVPIGILDDFEYELASIEVGKGDRLVLYTDGIHEAPDKNGNMFGISKLQQLVAAGKGDLSTLGKHIVHDVQTYIDGTRQADDMCLVIVGRR
jgi:serine phosphatase RsbU (regulator of sigma subunit)